MKKRQVVFMIAALISFCCIFSLLLPQNSSKASAATGQDASPAEGNHIEHQAIVCMPIGSEKRSENEALSNAELLMQIDSKEILEGLGAEKPVGLYLVQAKHETTEEIIEQAEQEESVIFAEPDTCFAECGEGDSSNDITSQQWAFGQSAGGMDVPGWNDLRDSSVGKNNAQGAVVALCDSGVNVNHEDLRNVLWDEGLEYEELSEMGGGQYGFCSISGADSTDVADKQGHGTQCAGMIGAEWNDTGISGVADGVKIMTIKHYGEQLTMSGGIKDLSCSSIIRGYQYVVKAKTCGVNVVATSNSFTTWLAPDIMALQVALDEVTEHGILAIFATGNDGLNLDIRGPWLKRARYDSNAGGFVSDYYNPGVIMVQANSQSGGFYSNNSYGATSTDIAAPGENVLTTTKDGGYTTVSGTSFAAPAVAGEAAILATAYPDESAEQIAARIRSGVQETSAFQGKCTTGGIAKVSKALDNDQLPPIIMNSYVKEGTLYIEGHYFGEETGQILLGETDCTDSISLWSDTAIRLTLPESITAQGSYQITIRTAGNVAHMQNISIDPLQSISVNVTLEKETYEYTGSVIKPNVIVRNDVGERLTENADYEITRPDSKNAGQYTLTVSFINDYADETDVTKSYTIVKGKPTYTIPEDTIAYCGDTLSDVDLPFNFQWDDPETEISGGGEQTFPATFTPDDENYETETGIMVPVTVLHVFDKRVSADAYMLPCSCEEIIRYYKSCVCGASSAGTEDQEIFSSSLRLQHDWSDWTLTKEPTCVDQGERTRTCHRDESHVETEEIDANGHTEEIIEGVPATETQSGLTDGSRCTVCGQILETQKYIAPLKQPEMILNEANHEGNYSISKYMSNGVSHIYYGNKADMQENNGNYAYTYDYGTPYWRILDNSAANNESVKGHMFLMSEYLWGANRPESPGDSRIKFNHSAAEGHNYNEWQGSSAQEWCQDFYSSGLFSAVEKTAVDAVGKEDFTGDKPYYAMYQDLDYYMPVPEYYGAYFRWGPTKEDPEIPQPASNPSDCNLNTTDHVFFISVQEVADKISYAPSEKMTAYIGPTSIDDQKSAEKTAKSWMLRTPEYDSGTGYGVVSGPEGRPWSVFNGGDFNYARPAFNLDLSNVLFASAAEGGKAVATAVNSSLQEVAPSSGTDWKLTLLDSQRAFSISNVKKVGNMISFNYSNAVTGAHEYVSAIVVDEGRNIKYYGRLVNLSEAGASGSANIDLGGITLEETDKLYVFNEQINEDYLTDYASALQLADVAESGEPEQPEQPEPPALISIKDAKVVLAKASAVYNKMTQKPVVKTIDGKFLKIGTDYTMTISKGSENITAPKNAGTYTLTITGKGSYTGTTKAKYTITKARNPFAVRGKTAVVKYSAVKKKPKTISRSAVFSISSSPSSIKYAKISGNKRIVVSSGGSVKVKKGIKRGLYKVKVRVTARANTNYLAGFKTVTFKLKVK